MIEKPPQIKNTHFKKTFDILKNQECLELVKEINNRYLYWDKVKYKNKTSKYSAEDLWAAVKLTRTIDFKKITCGNYTFSFSQTDYIQKILHEFDLNIGGTLGADKLLPKDGKGKYLISSIMEEAVTARKKPKEMLRKNDKPSVITTMLINLFQASFFFLMC